MECVRYKPALRGACEKFGQAVWCESKFLRAQKWAQCPAQSIFPSTKNEVLFW